MPRYDLHAEYKRLKADQDDWNVSVYGDEKDKENYNADVTILDGVGQEDLDITQDGLLVMSTQFGKAGKKTKSGKLVKTCVDSDDDDLEFEDANKEEE